MSPLFAVQLVLDGSHQTVSKIGGPPRGLSFPLIGCLRNHCLAFTSLSLVPRTLENGGRVSAHLAMAVVVAVVEAGAGFRTGSGNT